MWDWFKERIIFDISKIIAGACIGFIVSMLITLFCMYMFPAIITALATVAAIVGTATGIIAFGILVGMGIGFCINAWQMYSQNPDDSDFSALNNAEPPSEVEKLMKVEKKLEIVVENIPTPKDHPANNPKEISISQLRNEKRMYRRLSQEWDKHSSTIISELLHLDGKITNDYKAFRPIKASLHRELSKNIFSTENFKNNFQNFHSFITNHEAYAGYPEVINIFKAYAALKEVRNEYKKNKFILNALYEDKSAKQSANAAKEEERREFRMWLTQTSHVSKQRIIELYPEEKDCHAMLKQCAALGVTVFDSNDPEESKTARREYYERKAAVAYNF